MNVPSISGPTFFFKYSCTKDYRLDERPADFGQEAFSTALFPHLYFLRRQAYPLKYRRNIESAIPTHLFRIRVIRSCVPFNDQT
jgi:hypothetical protein